MKNLITVFTFTLALGVPFAYASDDQCQKVYGDTVSQCAHNLSFLAPNLRAGAQKACVEDAKLAKAVCSSGENQCLNACQSAYASEVLICEQTYDPSTCGGSLACELALTQARSDCISAAVTALDTCNASCSQ